MKPFRKHVAIAVDSGGIKGGIVTRALAIMEEQRGQSSHETDRALEIKASQAPQRR
jgi:patatin-like phospholipase/acyl hydrolase